MPPIVKARYERFALAYFSGKTPGESATEAGFSPRSARCTGLRLLQNATVRARLAELQEAAASARIMTVQERKERLSLIGRSSYADFATAGPDGSWISVGPENANSPAIKRVTSRTEYDKDGDHPSVVIGLELYSPIDAIKELNKMDGSYAPTKTELTGKDGAPLLPDLGSLTDEQLERIARGKRGQKA